MEQQTNTLSKEEKKFCELFVHGCTPYSGNMVACYEKAFDKSDIESKHEIIQLLNRTDVKEYIRTIEEEDIEEAKYLRKRLSENLLGIMEETSTAVYRDRRGNELSPAPLRSVAVQAAKALMEIHPIKEAQINKLSIEGNEGGVVFNVIIPESKKTKEENGD
jgi:hypothetical protein